ncbi:MAG: SpoIIE family protein phosphatase, partial [Vampirovibrionia bacterium]
YSNGEWDEKLDESIGVKEIKQLSQSFNKMGEAIKEQIETIKQTTAQKERYQQELNIAAEIQQSILPQKFPPFPELENMIDLYGITKPAKEIGGDYYDFFKVSENKIGIVIADVSDKGAPSSFFMAMTRMIVREIAFRGASPAEVLRRTNYMLSLDNPHCMFVTLIYGEYDISTGCLRYANAGHNPPFIISKTGKITEVPLTRNLPLGIDTSTHYVTDEISIRPDETLLLYTDGITEAADKEDNMIGIEGFKNLLIDYNDISSTDLINKILEYVSNYCVDVPQHDDITMLALKNINYDGIMKDSCSKDDNNTISIKLPAKTDFIDKVADITSKVASESGFDEKEIYQLNLAIDEIISNLIMHSYSSSSLETFQLDLTPLENGLKVVITDYGVPFDFDKKIDKYNPEEANVEQSIGGVGLFLVAKSVDEVSYNPETADGNKIILIKYTNKS